MANTYFNEQLLVYSGRSVAACRNRIIFVPLTILLVLLYISDYSESIIILLLLFSIQNSAAFD